MKNKNIAIYIMTALGFVSATYANQSNSKNRAEDLKTGSKQSKRTGMQLSPEKEALYVEEFRTLLKELDILNLENIIVLDAKEAKKATDSFDTAMRFIKVLVPSSRLERNTFEENVTLLHFIKKKIEHFASEDKFDVDMLSALIDVYSRLSPKDMERVLDSKFS